MLREYGDRDPRGRRPSRTMEYVIGGVAALLMLALLISAISTIPG